MIQLSIIIVNYKSAQLIIDCLETVYAQTSSINFETIVVDNASGDASRDLITARYPHVIWKQLSYNAGFARANNEGIRNCRGNAVLLLNPDTLIEDRAIEHAYEKLQSSDAVACGVQLLNPDRTPQISGNYFMRDGLNYLLPLPFVGDFFKWMGNIFRVNKPNVPEATGTVEVDWINGAFLMVKKETIDQVGLLDEDFFLYAEEAEWCSRLRKKGKLCIYGQYHVIHLQGETANASFGSSGKGYYDLFDRKGLQILVSNLLRIRKQFGVGWLLLIFIFYLAETVIFPIGIFFDKVFNGKAAKFKWHHVTGYAANVFRTLQLIPKMITNKPYFYKV